MCGILAVMNFCGTQPDKELIIQMRDTMYHRGPDDAGLYSNGAIAMGHRRLSIIDLSETGRQPMKNEDGSLVLIFNGEIYNYVELRKTLQKKGHIFSSTSDSEVILHQYEEDGVNCLQKLNGMFGFVLWDSRKRIFFAARDRLGIKPLYYYNDRGKVIIASEIKAIIEDPDVQRIIDYRTITDYMFAGRPLRSKTMFQNIKEVEPGYMISVDQSMKSVRKQQYWDVNYDYNYSRTDEEFKIELSDLLNDSIRMHCRSDAPLGCHLSGGLDTSSVVAFAALHRKKLKTFSIKFSEDSYIDETIYAKAVASHVGADYYEETPSSMDMATLFPHLMWHMDSPMATDGGFAYYTVSNLAKNYVKVALTGHGGDEVFAGYPAQFKATYSNTDMFDIHSDPVASDQSSSVKQMLWRIFHKRPSSIFKSIMNRCFQPKKNLEDIWIQLHCGYLPLNHSPIFHKQLISRIQGYSPRDDYVNPFLTVNTNKKLDKCLYHDLKVYLPGLLHLEDRASMAVSLESRVPLLDYRIIELLATVPPAQKIRGMHPKYLLKRSVKSLLPEQVWKRRDKFPFPVPANFWLSPEMEKMKKDILLSHKSLERGVFKPSALKNACTNVNMTWAFFNIELWFRVFIDGDLATV